MRKIRFFSTLISLFFLNACGVSRQGETYTFDGNSPIILSVENHPHGYNKKTCFNCHLPQNIHLVDRLGDPSFAFARSFVEQRGLSSCSGCHGNNGVSQ